MSRYLARRLLQAVPLIIVISFLSFLLIARSPGGLLAPYTHGRRITAAQLAVLKHSLGLDQAWYVQYWRWLGRAFRGDLGYSFSLNEPVVKVIAERIPATLELILAAVIVAALVALPLGVISAQRKYGLFDTSVTIGSFVGYSMPVFIIGYLLMFVFSIKFVDWFGWGFPSGGQTSVGGQPSLFDYLAHLALPAATLAIAMAAGWSRFVRSSVLEQMRADFVRTARAKGLSERAVMVRHVLRTSLIPVVTEMAIEIPLLFGGTIVTEQVWSWPGIGQLMIKSLDRRDLPVAMGLLVLIAILVILGNLIADICYAILDPRIRYE